MTHEALPVIQPTDLGQPVVALGDQLGLPDGQFVVERNIYDNPHAEDRRVIDTYTEQGGWAVKSASEVVKSDGTKMQVVEIKNYNDGSTKKLPLDRLKSWQPKVEDNDITVPRSELLQKSSRNIGALATHTEQPDHIQEVKKSRLTERQQELFAPFIESENEDDIDYARFLDPNADFTNLKVEDAAVRNEGRAPSDDSVERAEIMLEAPSLDFNVKQIISRSNPNLRNKEDIIKFVREDASVREELASYFLQKVATLPNMPARIVANGMKSTGFKGYEGKPQPTSQEFASLLALSMLDGTFKQESVADGIVKNSDGEVVLGQHRYAAEAILFY